MILQVTFSDGSNPWVSFAHDRKTIAKHWRRWMKYHPDTAQPEATANIYHCRPWHGGGYVIYTRVNWRLENPRFYKTLGHALAALERLEGERP